MRIAIASSGLGHVQRGIEAWASDVADALRRRGADVTLFGHANDAKGDIEGLTYFKRTGRVARLIAAIGRQCGAWRIGIGNAYDFEQFSFSLALFRRIRHDYDILHVQDPRIALLLSHAHRRGWSRPRVILANGTGESLRTLCAMPIVQELSPSAARSLSEACGTRTRIFQIPNFIDVDKFVPGNQAAARARLDLPQDAYIILSAAAIRRPHKRIDYLITEAAQFIDRYPGKSMLLVVGGREAETDEMVALGRRILGDKVRFMINVPRASMLDIYHAADVLALSSLFETFGIVLLEAMATGLPLVCHDADVFRYVAGPAARFSDFETTGAMAELFHRLADRRCRQEIAALARPHVVARFSEEAVVPQIARMYDEILRQQQ